MREGRSTLSSCGVMDGEKDYCFISLYRGTINPFSCYISPNQSKTLGAAILHCFDTFMLAFIATPITYMATSINSGANYYFVGRQLQ